MAFEQNAIPPVVALWLHLAGATSLAGVISHRPPWWPEPGAVSRSRLQLPSLGHPLRRGEVQRRAWNRVPKYALERNYVASVRQRPGSKRMPKRSNPTVRVSRNPGVRC